MRGSPFRLQLIETVVGIIPAHAGLTKKLRQSSQRCRDHPRACGAHPFAFSDRLRLRKWWGSSPRMRGSRRGSRAGGRCPGIIPAHAGLTIQESLWHDPVRDHPRACGAHPSVPEGSTSSKGSSPRMRGSHQSAYSCLLSSGIIPAHAGLTFSLMVNAHFTWDHPRACGAHRADFISA